MIYAYEDTPAVETPQTPSLPAEAVSINGTYLETIIAGYRTLYVSGRESLATELDTFSVGTADGERVKGRRYPARVLTVGFQLLADTDADFRLRFNQLNNILSAGEADFVFNDEADKFFTGYAVMDAEVEAGRNNVTGEWKIYCAYPFKRSIALTTLSSDDLTGVVVDENSATFTFNYDGTAPAKPILRATFASGKTGGDYNEDGDCGFVAFLNQDESIIQLGNPDATDIEAEDKNTTLINSVFDSFTGWTHTGFTIETITDPHWNDGQGDTRAYASTSRISTTAPRTGTMSRTTAGCVNLEFDIVHRLTTGFNIGNGGSFKAHLKNNDTVVVGFEIIKKHTGKTGEVSYILNDNVVGTDTIDLTYYNPHFGFCEETDLYVTQGGVTYAKSKMFEGRKKEVVRVPSHGLNYLQSNLNSGIRREGNVVTFSIGELPDRTFKDSSIENVAVYDVVFDYQGDFYINAIGSCALIKKKQGLKFSDIPNVFTAGDIVEADCNVANVYLYRNGSAIGHLEPQYGALGNDWEDFAIKTGQNVIQAVWSDWVDENYKPKIEIVFNKVYI